MSRLRRLLRRRRRPVVFLVDAAAYDHLCEMAAIGEALEVIAAAELRWLALDLGPGDDGPWHD